MVMRPPASELAATNPTSDAALTLNGSSLTVPSSVVEVAGAVGAAWPNIDCTPRPKRAAAVARLNLGRFGFIGLGRVFWAKKKRRSSACAGGWIPSWAVRAPNFHLRLGTKLIRMLNEEGELS